MAPRKKRGAKSAIANRKKGLAKRAAPHVGEVLEEVIEVNDGSEENPASDLNSEPNTSEPCLYHKKFRKFRNLLESNKFENNSSSNEALNLEQSQLVSKSEDEGDEEIKPSVLNDTESLILGLESLIGGTENLSKSITHVELEEGSTNSESIENVESSEQPQLICEDNQKKAEMEFSTVENSETITAQISDQLSHLDVNKSSEANLTPGEDGKDLDFVKDSRKPQEIVLEEIVEEFNAECVPEEVIPIGDEQEIGINNENSQDSVVQCEDIIEQKPEIKEELKEIKTEVEEEAKPPESEEMVDDKKIVKSAKVTRCKRQKCTSKKSVKVPATKVKKSREKPRLKTKAEKKIMEKHNSDTSESSILSESSVRRSSRIKSISVLKQRSQGHGLVKPKTAVKITKSLKVTFNDSDASENSNSGQTDSDKTSQTDSPRFATPSSGYDSDHKPVKVKSRWRRSSELEMGNHPPVAVNRLSQAPTDNIQAPSIPANPERDKPALPDEDMEKRLKQFVHVKENHYLTDRLCCKEAKKMTCDCFLTPEEMERGEFGCGEDCLNRLLMIECGPLCPVGERCTNKRFQKTNFSPSEVFRTEKKGLGIRAIANIPFGEFILEYVGEVIDPDEFEDRAAEYSKEKNPHYYFMALRSDAVIDATQKGNISRFINHSCEPNAETQKWTVNGELRIGFFSKRTILEGEEITFDYHFQRYGKEAQKCYCEAPSCRGWLGEEPDDIEDEEDEEEGEETENERDQEPSIEEVTTPVEGEVAKPLEVKQSVPKEKRKYVRRKPRKEIFDDVDLDEEIGMLLRTGLKNQAHTLKLSRLMVRASDIKQKSQLLRILRHGELPCRRLFLDYHGLRLMYGWMTTQYNVKDAEKQESLRLEILQTLATLPIPNKTMLQDSKVLATVEKWSITIPTEQSPVDSNSSSPSIESDHRKEQVITENVEKSELKKDKVISPIKKEINGQKKTVKKKEEKPAEDDVFDIRKSVGMDIENIRNKSQIYEIQPARNIIEELTEIFDEDMDISPIANFDDNEIKKTEVPVEEKNYAAEITALAAKLLEEWANLKEAFRIPRKERIEQMKEHEREADRGYKAGLGLENDSERKSEKRYRLLQRHRAIERTDSFDRTRKNLKMEDRNASLVPRLNKHERRKLFALQVEHREEERRRKQHELWRQQMLMGGGVQYDPSKGYHYVWNPSTGQWQTFPVPNQFNPVQTPIPGYSYNNIAIPPPNMPLVPGGGVRPMPTPPLPTNPLGNVTPNLNMPALPPLPYQDEISGKEDPSKVKFMGPIPPPVKLPPKWKCANDKYGRPYYYHIKIRKTQWEPPEYTSPPQEDVAQDDLSESSSSSETSTLSSSSSSEESESDDEFNDTKLMLEICKKFKLMDNKVNVSPILEISEIKTESLKEGEEKKEPIVEESNEDKTDLNLVEESSSLDERLKEEFTALKQEILETTPKKKRLGLVQEIIISPRSEDDKLQAKENLKRYKQNKERLKRQKELLAEDPTKKRVKVAKAPKAPKKHKSNVKIKIKEMTVDANSELSKKVKEAFRSDMASVMVSILNPFRKVDCKEGRITNTDDFKHLARKLTHFVMLKELKHCQNIEELTCTESVKAKAKEFVRKYMSKFGEIYHKPKDEIDY